MAEYYNYASPKVDSQIDWATVGKEISDSLSDVNKKREAERQSVDDETRKFINTINTAPQGEYRDANQFLLQAGGQAQTSMLQLNRQLKSGKINMKQYVSMRQNLVDGFDNVMGTMKDYQAQYSDSMARLQGNKSQKLEGYVMAGAEALGNFSSSQVYINPVDYTVGVGKTITKDVDGKKVTVMSDDPNDFTQINTLRNRIRTKYDKLDTYKILDDQVKRLGKETQVMRSVGDALHAGSITEIMDITQREGIDPETKEVVNKFNSAEDAFLGSVLAQPTNISSVLTENVVNNPKTGKPYGFTWDPKAVDENTILIKNDASGVAMPVFDKSVNKYGEEQYKVAKDFLRDQFRIMIDKDVKFKSVNEPKPPPVHHNDSYDTLMAKFAHGYTFDGSNRKVTKEETDMSGSLIGYLDDNFKPALMEPSPGLTESTGGAFVDNVKKMISPFGFKASNTINNVTIEAPDGEEFKFNIKDVKDKQAKLDEMKAFIIQNTPKSAMGSAAAVSVLYPYAKRVPATPQGQTPNKTEESISPAERMRREAAKNKNKPK